MDKHKNADRHKIYPSLREFYGGKRLLKPDTTLKEEYQCSKCGEKIKIDDYKKWKRRSNLIVIILSIISSVVLIVLLALFIRIYIVPTLNIGDSQINNPETFLMASQSPDGKYNLEAYRTEPGATVDFSVRVYLTTGDRKTIIYDAYHEYEAKIVWIDNTTVSINGITLDISQGEKYDWRMQ